MFFYIQDKSERVLHCLNIEGVDASLRLKQHLLRKTDFDRHAVKQIYVHVPYCFFHCSFCVYRGELLKSRGQLDEYMSQLLAEIAALGPLVEDVSFQSVFVGGGTVTVLNNAHLSGLITAIRDSFNVRGGNGEFTVELAPHGLSEAKLDTLVEAGVNRVTMGLQSLDPGLLEFMNRPRIDDAKLKGLIDAIHSRPFIDFNVDLMVGISGRTYENLLADFRQLARWGCESIMVYIDMHAYRDESRESEVARYKAMVSRLAEEVSGSYTLNRGHGVNEYNRFVTHERSSSPAFGSRYSTDYQNDEVFCLGVGRQAKSWNRELVFYSS